MKCLLLAATFAEIAPAVDYFKQSEKRLHIDMELDVLVGGVGMLATAYRLTRHIALRRPDMIIQAGIAGCFDRAVPLCKVYAVKQEALADTGVWEKQDWTDLFDMKLMKKQEAPFKNGRLVNPHKTLLQRCKLPLAKAVTVNQTSTGRKQISAIYGKYQPLLESMEGAALHYVALQENTPFLQLRSVSNYIGERNKSKWNISGAITSLNGELVRLFEGL